MQPVIVTVSGWYDVIKSTLLVPDNQTQTDPCALVTPEGVYVNIQNVNNAFSHLEVCM